MPHCYPNWEYIFPETNLRKIAPKFELYNSKWNYEFPLLTLKHIYTAAPALNFIIPNGIINFQNGNINFQNEIVISKRNYKFLAMHLITPNQSIYF